MHKLVSQLVVYRNLPADNLLEPLADICARFAGGNYNREKLTAQIYEQINKLLDIGTSSGSPCCASAIRKALFRPSLPTP